MVKQWQQVRANLLTIIDKIPPHNESFTLGWLIWHVLEREVHHRGELSLALGLLEGEGLDV